MKFYQVVLGLIIVILSAWIFIRIVYPISRLHPTRIKELYDTVGKTDELFTTNNMPYWMSAGTLLGSVRNGGIIPWDDDIDIGIMKVDFPRFIALKEKFANAGIEMIKTDHIWRLRKIGGTTWIDVFVYIQDGDRYVEENSINRARFPKDWIKVHELTPLSRLKFGPHQLLAPAKFEPFIVRMYGSNWKTPIALPSQQQAVLGNVPWYHKVLIWLANVGGRPINIFQV